MTTRKTTTELRDALWKIYPPTDVPKSPTAYNSYMSNFVYRKMDVLAAEHLAFLVGVSRFCIKFEGDNPRIESFPISLNMILDTMRLSSRYSRDVKNIIDDLIKHDVVTIMDVNGNNINDDDKRYKGLFVLKQKSAYVIEDVGDENYDALLDTEFANSIHYTTLSIKDVDTILGSKNTKGNRESLLSVYASIRSRIYNYKIDAVNGKSKARNMYIELSKAVNWEGRDAIAKRIGITPRTLTRRMTELIDLKVIAVYYVGYKSVHVTDNRMYISSHSDLGVMQRYISHQIENGEARNLFDLRQNATGDLEQASS